MNTENTNIYRRSEILFKQYISFLISSQVQKDNYYSIINLDHLLQLKSILSNVNNIVTLLATKTFARQLSKALSLSEEDTSSLFNEVENKNANSNGFDIMLETKNYNIIAEIKCNKPINNGDKMGQQQKSGIWDDALKLLNGGKEGIHTQDYIKIIAISNFDYKDWISITNSITQKVKIKSQDEQRIKRIDVIDKLKTLSSVTDIPLIVDKQYIYIVPISYHDIEFELSNSLKNINIF